MHSEIRKFWEKFGALTEANEYNIDFWRHGRHGENILNIYEGKTKLYRFKYGGEQYNEKDALKMIKLKAFW